MKCELSGKPRWTNQLNKGKNVYSLSTHAGLFRKHDAFVDLCWKYSLFYFRPRHCFQKQVFVLFLSFRFC